MQKQTWFITLGVLLGGAAVVVLWAPRRIETAAPTPGLAPRVESPRPSAPAPTPVTQTAQRSVEPPTAPATGASAPRPEHAVTAANDESGPTVRVQPGRALATVNGVSITLQNLAGLPAAQAGQEQAWSFETYAYLLDRAIERELVSQAARAQRAELTPEQQQRLTEMRRVLETPAPSVVRLTMTPEQSEFELRDAEALMLEANMAAQAGVPSPHVTPELVEQYYQEHKANYGELPGDPDERLSAWRKIDRDIRQILAPDLQARHEQASRQFLDQLKATARISTVAKVD